MKNERRWIPFTEVRAMQEEGKRTIGGYAAVFNKFSEVLWNFKEKIAPGAFSRSLEKNDVVALWSHNTDVVLGRTGNETLELTEDKRGLNFKLELPDSPWGENAYAAIERGDVNGMSFGFMVREEEWKRGKGDKPHERTLTDVDLLEISPTAFPAYKQTKVGTRDVSAPEDVVKKREEEWAHNDKEQEQDKEAPTGMSVNARRLALAESE